MITLTKRMRQETEGSKPNKTKKEESRVSIRDKLLVKEVGTMDGMLDIINNDEIQRDLNLLICRFKNWKNINLLG